MPNLTPLEELKKYLKSQFRKPLENMILTHVFYERVNLSQLHPSFASDLVQAYDKWKKTPQKMSIDQLIFTTENIDFGPREIK